MATPPLSTNLLGILSAMAAATAFTLNDVAIKFLSGDYPLHEVVLIRALFGLVFVLAVVMPLEGGYANMKSNHPRLQILRGLLVVTANMCFFLGIAALPLAEATAILFVAPLIITAFSVIFLGETVGWRRWLAVGIGLIGAVIMLRPGAEAFQPAALLPLAAAVCYAGLNTVTRKIGTRDSASTMAFYIQVVFIVMSALIGLGLGHGRFTGSGDPSLEFLLRAWVLPDLGDLAVMAGAGLASATGGYFISQAYRLCESALVAPFEYLGLALAILWGVVIFNEWPDLIAWTGIAFILGGGLFVFWREARGQRARVGKRPMIRNR